MSEVENALFGHEADSFISSHDDVAFLSQKHYVFETDAPEAEEVPVELAKVGAPEHAIEKEVKARQTKCSRAFQLTLNEPAKWDALLKYLNSFETLAYCLAGKEKAPDTGHEHIHVYAQFKKPVRLAIRKIEGAHIEACKGSAQQNIAYIKNEGKKGAPPAEIIYEHGEPILKGGYTVEDVKKMKPADREKLPACYFNIVQKLNAEDAADIDVDDLGKEVHVFYFYGSSGAGKTVLAKKRMKELCPGAKINNLKYESGFWHGVGSAEVALYDDYRDSHMPASEFINFIDYNVHEMNIKGGGKPNRYKWIFITSIQDPRWIYTNAKNADESLRQWLRRMKIFKVEPNAENPLDPIATEVPYE